jgi:hypothetical protein
MRNMVEESSNFWKELLIKYMGYVRTLEGTSFLTFNEYDCFTKLEWDALQRCKTKMEDER